MASAAFGQDNMGTPLARMLPLAPDPLRDDAYGFQAGCNEARRAPALTGRRQAGPIAGSRPAFAVTALQAEPPVSSQRPFDATVVAYKAADVLAYSLIDLTVIRRDLPSV